MTSLQQAHLQKEVPAQGACQKAAVLEAHAAVLFRWAAAVKEALQRAGLGLEAA